MGTVCFPFAAYYVADLNHKEAMNALARSWPTVAGVIRSGAIERKMTGWASALWALDVRYDYTVDGRTYAATTLGFAAHFVADKKTTINASLRFTGPHPVFRFSGPPTSFGRGAPLSRCRV